MADRHVTPLSAAHLAGAPAQPPADVLRLPSLADFGNDLTGFLGELCAAALGYYRPEQSDEAVYASIAGAVSRWWAERAADGEGGYPPSLPWARHLDADDLEGFLADLADAAAGTDDLNTLRDIEDVIGRWRVIADADRAHRTAPGPNALAADGEVTG